MDTDNLIVYVESKDICTDLTGNNKKGFDTYNYEVKRPLPIGKNEKKDWLDEGWVGWRNNERVIRREIKL